LWLVERGGRRDLPEAAGISGLSVCATFAADFGIQESLMVLALVNGGDFSGRLLHVVA